MRIKILNTNLKRIQWKKIALIKKKNHILSKHSFYIVITELLIYKRILMILDVLILK